MEGALVQMLPLSPEDTLRQGFGGSFQEGGIWTVMKDV